MKQGQPGGFGDPKKFAAALRKKAGGSAFDGGPKDEADDDSDLKDEPNAKLHPDDRSLFAKHSSKPDNPVALAALKGGKRAKALASAKREGVKRLKGVVTAREFEKHKAEASKAGAKDPAAYAAAVLHKKLGYKG